MSDDKREIIDIEDWEIVSDEISPIVDEDEEPPPPYDSQVWQREVRTSGPGCCFGLSLTVLVFVGIFLLGLCALCWLILMAIGLL